MTRSNHCPECGRPVLKPVSKRQAPRPRLSLTIEGEGLLRSALKDAMPKLELAVKKAMRDALRDRGRK